MKRQKTPASKLVRIGRHLVELRIVSRVQAKDLGKTSKPKRRAKAKRPAAPKPTPKRPPRRGRRK